MKPTKKQIEKEIETLKNIKEKVVHFSKFGDDNHLAIETQIKTLEKNWDESEVYDLPLSDYAQSSAIQAIEWRDGLEDMKPSEDWKGLVK